jgi:hypothetical protein
MNGEVKAQGKISELRQNSGGPLNRFINGEEA